LHGIRFPVVFSCSHVEEKTPSLHRQCNNVDEVIKRCPNGLYAEIKYDGERLQIHKEGDKFEFFSRNLKKVLPWKVFLLPSAVSSVLFDLFSLLFSPLQIEPVKEYVLKATDAASIILDCEILLMDSVTRKPLPFGTLAVHKKNLFQNATVCIFLFDILLLNGKPLMSEPLETRRNLLESNIKVKFPSSLSLILS
jgi:DNA ligase-3